MPPVYKPTPKTILEARKTEFTDAIEPVDQSKRPKLEYVPKSVNYSDQNTPTYTPSTVENPTDGYVPEPHVSLQQVHIESALEKTVVEEHSNGNKSSMDEPKCHNEGSKMKSSGSSSRHKSSSSSKKSSRDRDKHHSSRSGSSSKEPSSSTHKSVDKRSSKHSSSSRRHHSSSSSRSKDTHTSSGSSRSKSKHRERPKDKESKHSSSSSRPKERPEDQSSSTNKEHASDGGTITDDDLANLSYDEDDIEAQCRLIFEEYNAQCAKSQTIPSTSNQTDSFDNETKIDPVAEKYANTGIKSRAAHANADNVERPVRPIAINHEQSAMQVRMKNFINLTIVYFIIIFFHLRPCSKDKNLFVDNLN